MTVYLVGAGPGDPGLLTVRGAALLRRADAVVHDRLIDARLLGLAPEHAVRVDVGKRPGDSAHQGDITRLLIELGGRLECVVRLKGGDPYVFGRGGEEALALDGAGIAFEVVPGVSSVNGVLAYAGIPLTHRGLSEAVTVVTGHVTPLRAGGSSPGEPAPGDSFQGEPAPGVDWDAVAAVGGTVVVLMGVAQRGTIARALIGGGRQESTPVAVIESGTSAAQRTVRTTLGNLGETEVGTPALIVVGEVASLDLSWFERRPLFGWTVAVTRAPSQAAGLVQLLEDQGASAIEVPVIEIGEAADGGAAMAEAANLLADSRARGGPPGYRWVVFASTNAVGRFWDRLGDVRDLGSCLVAAVGDSTAAALRDRGVAPDLVPGRFDARALVDSFPTATSSGGDPEPRVLLPQAGGAGPALAEGLSSKGWEVDVVEAYRTVRRAVGPDVARAAASADAVAFTSPSTVAGYLDAIGKDRLAPVVACIGPVTAASARDSGLRVDVESGVHTAGGLVDALVAYAAGLKGPPR